MRTYKRVERLGNLVELPLVATLATYRRNGEVLLSPVWHEWRDGGFNVIVEADDIKARHVRRDPRASIALYESDPPYRGLQVSGHARLVSRGAAAALRRIAVRYLGREAGEAYGAGGSEVVLRLEPGELRAWDFADEEWEA